MAFRHWFTFLFIMTLIVQPVYAGDDDVEDPLDILDDDRDDDDLDDRLEDSEEVEDDLEEQLEDRLEDAEELEDDLEDRLEDMLEEQQERDDELEDDLEDRLEDQLERLQQQQDEQAGDDSERLQNLWQLEEQIEELDALVVADEFIALVSAAELEQLLSRDNSVIASEPLDELGAVLVTFSNEQESQRYQADNNHLYQLDAQATAAPALTVADAAEHMGIAPDQAPEVTIGMMDSSIESGHECLRDSRVQQKSFFGKGQPATAHGTAIAALMVGRCGLLPQASLVNAAVFASSAQGTVVASAHDMIAGLNWLVGQQVELINLSLSGPANRILEQALQQVISKGIRVVASAGNDGAAAYPRYPAAYPGVIAVTAVDQQLAVYPRAVRGLHLDFAAPGVDVAVAATAGGMTSMSGTSVAAALASATLAVAGQQPMTLQQLRVRALDLGEPGKDPVFGDGLLRLHEKKVKKYGIKFPLPRLTQ